MKLQNNQTGQVENFCIDKDKICSCDRAFVYDSLTQLQEAGWQDYKEPKVIYYISWDGVVLHSADKTGWQDAKLIGNYFETQEEAEKAVEKLKAWKRLKDKGIYFEIKYSRYTDEPFTITGDLGCTIGDETKADLNLLFGGEE